MFYNCFPAQNQQTQIVHAQIFCWLHENRLLDVYQTGFQKSRSTQTALLKVIDDIKQNCEKTMITVLVLFDFSKAFNMVGYKILLSKIRVNLNLLKHMRCIVYADDLQAYLSCHVREVLKPNCGEIRCTICRQRGHLESSATQYSENENNDHWVPQSHKHYQFQHIAPNQYRQLSYSFRFICKKSRCDDDV